MTTSPQQAPGPHGKRRRRPPYRPAGNRTQSENNAPSSHSPLELLRAQLSILTPSGRPTSSCPLLVLM